MNWQDEFDHNKWLPVAVFALCLVIMLFFIGTAHAEELKASWYSVESLIKEGTRQKGEKPITASGEVFKDDLMTCACRLYPLGSVLKITNLENGKAVVVKVNDKIGKRFAKTRIDLSKGAFQKIANLKQGLIKIKVEVIK